jgi:ketosteroid isomerase-like protein
MRGLRRSRRVDKLAALQGVYREWERGSYSAGLELYDPEMTLEVHNPIPDAGVYEDLEGLQQYMRRFLATWDEYELELLEMRADGDHVIAHIRHRGLGRSSGARVEMTYCTVWTFQGSRAIRVDIAQKEDVALQAARSTIL